MTAGWFTPQSARRTARRLEPLARRVCLAYRRLHEIAPAPRQEAAVDRAYFDEVCRFHLVALRLSSEGVLFRDLDKGWFEFPGRHVRLEWRIQLDDPGDAP